MPYVLSSLSSSSPPSSSPPSAFSFFSSSSFFSFFLNTSSSSSSTNVCFSCSGNKNIENEKQNDFLKNESLPVPPATSTSLSSSSCASPCAVSSSSTEFPPPSSSFSACSFSSFLSYCPFSEQQKSVSAGDERSEKLNSANMIYETPNAPVFDTKRLSTKREISSIPKATRSSPPPSPPPPPPHEGGKDDHQDVHHHTYDRQTEMWEYPSAQQFYNIMRRKNKEVDEADMPSVVYVHNTVNERSWKELLEWEKMHNNECSSPALSRFMGRYDDLSPKAFFISKFTQLGRPFDRHDWYVDRCGKNVRYILDYYDDQSRHDDPLKVYVDVRPALDSFSALWDRIRKPFYS